MFEIKYIILCLCRTACAPIGINWKIKNIFLYWLNTRMNKKTFFLHFFFIDFMLSVVQFLCQQLPILLLPFLLLVLFQCNYYAIWFSNGCYISDVYFPFLFSFILLLYRNAFANNNNNLSREKKNGKIATAHNNCIYTLPPKFVVNCALRVVNSING